MNKKLAVLCLMVLGLVALGSQASAVICTIDDVPAATLLLPYFEVDAANGNGITTLFSINNASATAVLAHVTVWTDLSVPVLDFNVYLTGYDVQSINLRDILINGVLPQTASAGQDPHDTISPKGDFSQDINFASCSGQLPPPATLPADFLAYLRAALTGTPQTSSFITCSSNPCCAAQSFGDNILRGYVTIDTVNNCTLRFPNVESYWLNDATFQNVLWGDAFFVNSGQNFASGNPLVHIEASLTNPETSGPASGNYTFAGRYVNWTTEDHREPLATNFAVRFVNGGPFSGGTNLHVWRDSKFNQGAFHCTTLPSGQVPWYPLGQEGIVIFDEQEQPVLPTPFPVSPPGTAPSLLPFPAETQSTVVGSDRLPVPYNFGWLYLDLNTTVPAAGNVPPEDPAAAQAWVEVQMNAEGRYEVGYSAIQLDSACVANHVIPGG
jgi:hypothetical protein